ncbi:hypothetical protein GP475_03335 [Corynebacterium poyangense]|uniref:PQQ-like domain-containing protein n=1 Tax=Corynebacterium poyangense TaxID=2684405 RepID=A0A7H0SML5_9CORY|nr:hypothetical protein [Corynebacterium poyangense]QNQ89790.1 hypothetical protein GP475_03335 [Corynebacterium poyangense]
MKPLRRTQGDLIATAVISLICLAAILGTWYLAPIRHSHLDSSHQVFESAPVPDVTPQAVRQLWSIPDAQPAPGQQSISPSPVIAQGVVVVPNNHGVHGVDPRTGEELWRYDRAESLCAVASTWSKVTAIFDAGFGCDDVIQIEPTTGTYGASRSAISENPVGLLQSNDRVGVIGPQRVELWRSDLVRTIEYGDIPAPQEPDLQPHPECTPTSAMTRTNNLVIVEQCPDEQYWVRVMKTTPKDSRAPEVQQSFQVGGPQPVIVALGEKSLSLYNDGVIQSYSFAGQELSRAAIPNVDPAVFTAPVRLATADLPHHMTWFDGHSLRLFDPTNLHETQHFDDALGTGVALGQRLVYPVAQGLAVARWEDGHIDRIIPVDRQGWTGPVSLKLAGDVVVEQRGGTLVGLQVSG